jgi:tRNA A37 threonylcarbamoyladenosine dehydratase
MALDRDTKDKDVVVMGLGYVGSRSMELRFGISSLRHLNLENHFFLNRGLMTFFFEISKMVISVFRELFRK